MNAWKDMLTDVYEEWQIVAAFLAIGLVVGWIVVSLAKNSLHRYEACLADGYAKSYCYWIGNRYPLPDEKPRGAHAP